MISPVRRARSRRGSALVEFAIVGFLLTMVLLGTVEVDRMFLVYTAVADAARAGVRYAITHGATRPDDGTINGQSYTGQTTQVETLIKNVGSTGLLDPSKLTITISYPNGNAPGSPVTVKVVYPYDPFVGWFTMMSGAQLGSTTQGVITF
jgi:Flp pilus assembly protein TadG